MLTQVRGRESGLSENTWLKVTSQRDLTEGKPQGNPGRTGLRRVNCVSHERHLPGSLKPEETWLFLSKRWVIQSSSDLFLKCLRKDEKPTNCPGQNGVSFSRFNT